MDVIYANNVEFYAMEDEEKWIKTFCRKAL